jgi:hypothetical protein
MKHTKKYSIQRNTAYKEIQHTKKYSIQRNERNAAPLGYCLSRYACYAGKRGPEALVREHI